MMMVVNADLSVDMGVIFNHNHVLGVTVERYSLQRWFSITY